MSGNRVFLFLLLVLILLLPGRSGALDDTVPPDISPINAKIRSADKRLEKPVSIAAPRICIGELLERLSEQSGVKLYAEASEDASGIRVTAFLQNVPLGDVMNALWSMLSYKNAYWAWDQLGESGAYSYRFRQPRAIKDLSARLRQEAQDAFEKEVRDLLTALKMTPEQRKQLANAGQINTSLSFSQTANGLRLFDELFTPEQQSDILRGKDSQEIPIDQLPSWAQDYVRSEWKNSNTSITRTRTDGTAELLTEPPSVRFSAHHFNSSALANDLFFYMGGGGPAIAGGRPLESALRKQRMANWMLSGDEMNDPQAKGKAQVSKQQTQEEADTRTIEKRLEQLSQSAPLSLIALLPTPQRNVASSMGGDGQDFQDYRKGPYGLQISHYIDVLLQFPPYLMHKWRGHVLLLQSVGWMETNEDIVGYGTIKHVRSLLQKNDNVLSVRDLAEIANSLNKAQLTCLSAEESPLFAGTVKIRDLFAYCYQHPRMASETGLPLDDETRALLRTIPALNNSPYLPAGKATTIRLKNQTMLHFQSPAVATFIQFLTPDGTWKNAGGVIQNIEAAK